MIISSLKTLFSFRGRKKKASPCPQALSWLIEKDNPFCPVHRRTTIIKNAGVQEGMTVLDAGCGPGRISIPLARKVGHKGKVVALDIQEGMLMRTQEKADVQNITNITFLHAGLGGNKLEKEKFDRVLLVTVLGEISDQELAMKEMFQALKPGGILSVTEIIFDPDFQSLKKVLQLATAVGFQKKGEFGNCIAFTLNFEKPVVL